MLFISWINESNLHQGENHKLTLSNHGNWEQNDVFCVKLDLFEKTLHEKVANKQNKWYNSLGELFCNDYEVLFDCIETGDDIQYKIGV